MFQLCDVSPKITGDGRPDRQFSPLNGTYGVLKPCHYSQNSELIPRCVARREIHN